MASDGSSAATSSSLRISNTDTAMTSTVASTTIKDTRPPEKLSFFQRHLPKSKCALIFVPLVIFSCCLSLLVLSILATTYTHDYISEEESSLLIIHSYPKDANFSIMAMSIYGMMLPMWQYLTNPQSRRFNLRKFYSYGYVAGCYYMLFIWALAEMTIFTSIVAKVNTHFAGSEVLVVNVILIVVLLVAILVYMFIPRNPLTRQREYFANSCDAEKQVEQKQTVSGVLEIHQNHRLDTHDDYAVRNAAIQNFLQGVDARDSKTLHHSTEKLNAGPESKLDTHISVHHDNTETQSVYDKNSLSTPSIRSTLNGIIESDTALCKYPGETNSVRHSFATESIRSVPRNSVDTRRLSALTTTPGTHKSEVSSPYETAVYGRGTTPTGNGVTVSRSHSNNSGASPENAATRNVLSSNAAGFRNSRVSELKHMPDDRSQSYKSRPNSFASLDPPSSPLASQRGSGSAIV